MTKAMPASIGPAKSSKASLEGAMAALEAGGDGVRIWAKHVAARLPELVFDELGASLARRALELLSPLEAKSFVCALRGVVAEAACSPHAHSVLEAVVERLSTDDAAFIAEEMTPHARAIAMSTSGSCVVVRLLEFSAEDERTTALVDAILEGDLVSLCCHKAGHLVAAAVLSNGLDHQRELLLQAIASNMQRHSRHRFAHIVVEAAFLLSRPGEDEWLASLLMAKPGALVALGCHAFGVNVVRAVLEVPGQAGQALAYIKKAQKRMLRDRFGAELLEERGFLAGRSEHAAAYHAVVGGA